MRSLYILFILILGFFSSQCSYIPQESFDLVEKIKNSPRDPRLFGAWKGVNLLGDTILKIYTPEAMIYTGHAIYNEQGVLVRYDVRKDSNSMFYCAYNNQIQMAFLQTWSILGKAPIEPIVEEYKISGDTLWCPLNHSEYKGRSLIKVENPVIEWK